MTSLHFRSAKKIACEIADGELTARDALEHFLDRVDRFNVPVNAIIHQDRHEARRRADAADAARKRGESLGPLHGVPMTIKESFKIAGTPSTFGLPHLKDNVASSTVVAPERLIKAGANVFGKTNVPAMLADVQSYNDIYGVTNNPWDLGRTSGGSSGGSAAALASGLTALELGTDIGGSIRNPAHYCGVFGHKPTFGLVPFRGHVIDDNRSVTDISVAGPLARSAFDLEIAMRVLIGPDVLDTPWRAENLPILKKPMRDLRIGIWMSDPICPPAAAVSKRLEEVADALSRAGAKIDCRSKPMFDSEREHEVFLALMVSATVGRMPDAKFEETIKIAEAPREGISRVSVGIARAQTMRYHEWLYLNEERTRFRWAWKEYFKTVDFLITPVMPTSAFPHDHSAMMDLRTVDVDGRAQPYLSQLFWCGLASVSYLPATVFPAGQLDDLPVGFQIIGPNYSDLCTIALAQRLEQMGFKFYPPRMSPEKQRHDDET